MLFYFFSSFCVNLMQHLSSHAKWSPICSLCFALFFGSWLMLTLHQIQIEEEVEREREERERGA